MAKLDGVSSGLKAAMMEIDEIIQHYDIDACVFLADGKQCGEFKMYHDKPTWSMIDFHEKGGNTFAHIKAYMKSSAENSDRTINAFYTIQGMMGQMWLANEQMLKQLEKTICIEKEKGKITTHQEFLKYKENKNVSGNKHGI